MAWVPRARRRADRDRGIANWGRHLAAFLGTAKFDVREVPPTRTSERRHRRRRPKTDREDALAAARETLGDANLPPAKPTLSVSEAQAELAVVIERRRSLIRRRQRLLNEAEGLLNKLPPELTAGLPKEEGVPAPSRGRTPGGPERARSSPRGDARLGRRAGF